MLKKIRVYLLKQDLQYYKEMIAECNLSVGGKEYRAEYVEKYNKTKLKYLVTNGTRLNTSHLK